MRYGLATVLCCQQDSESHWFLCGQYPQLQTMNRECLRVSMGHIVTGSSKGAIFQPEEHELWLCKDDDLTLWSFRISCFYGIWNEGPYRRATNCIQAQEYTLGQQKSKCMVSYVANNVLNENEQGGLSTKPQPPLMRLCSCVAYKRLKKSCQPLGGWKYSIVHIS